MSESTNAWPTTSLGSIALSVRNGLFARSPNDSGVGVRILRISSVRSGAVTVGDSRFVADVSEDRVSQFALRPDDLLMTRYNGSRHLVGISGLVPEHEGPLLHPDKLIRIVIDRTLGNPHFVNYQLESRAVREFLGPRIRTTAGQSGISGRDVREIPIVLPPLAEQRRVVEILEDHLSHLAVGDDGLSRASARLAALFESVLNEHVPEGIETRPLGELLDVPLSNGRSVRSRDGGFPVLRLTALRDSGVALAERKEGAWDRNGALPFLVSRGDFLIARGNGTLRLVGRGSLVREEPDEVAFPDTAIRARPRASDLLPEYLDVVWNARRTRDQIERVARTSAGIYKVNQSQLRAIQLPVPPVSEQSKVVAAMDEVRNHRDVALEAIGVVSRRSAALRRAVLAAAFEGKLTGRHTDTEVIEELAYA